jgi:hypothetical protein
MVEKYLKQNLPKFKRSILAQFRAGILPLEVETGRYELVRDNITGKVRRKLASERICKICNLNEIEDELHFACDCSGYAIIRTRMFEKIHLKFPDINIYDMDKQEKFITLNTVCWKLFSEYLCEAWTLRTRLLNS